MKIKFWCCIQRQRVLGWSRIISIGALYVTISWSWILFDKTVVRQADTVLCRVHRQHQCSTRGQGNIAAMNSEVFPIPSAGRSDDKYNVLLVITLTSLKINPLIKINIVYSYNLCCLLFRLCWSSLVQYLLGIKSNLGYWKPVPN